jgi:hypothetical protein
VELVPHPVAAAPLGHGPALAPAPEEGLPGDGEETGPGRLIGVAGIDGAPLGLLEDGAGDPSRQYLLGRLAVVEARVRSAVARRRSADPHPDDPFRGLYLSEGQIDRLLAGAPFLAAPIPPEARSFALELERAADAAEAAGVILRLRRLARAVGLHGHEVEILLIALAPDLDPRFERFYGYLHDDVTRRRATVGLALDLATDGQGRRLEASWLAPGANLLRTGLLVVEDPAAPFLARGLRVPDRVRAHLLGDDRPDPTIEPFLAEEEPLPTHEATTVVEAWARAGAGFWLVHERPGRGGRAWALSLMAALGRPVLSVDFSHLPGSDADPRTLVSALVREARLREAGLVAGPVEILAEVSRLALFDLVTEVAPLVLLGGAGWDPRWGPRLPLEVEPPVPTLSFLRGLWREALRRELGQDAAAKAVAGSDGHGGGGAGRVVRVTQSAGLPGGDDGLAGGDRSALKDQSGEDRSAGEDPLTALARVATEATVGFRLAPEQVRRAARVAVSLARLEGRAPQGEHFAAGARRQNEVGLERLARRVEPEASWGDLVLPQDTLAQLRELAGRIRQRHRVLTEWGMAQPGRGSGVTALFTGEPGTGKTLAAEVIARDLGLDVFMVDLAGVVDKYIGETEKNLDRVFTAAEGTNAVLLLDEADALFGKRSQIHDARDRYANVEVAYLLQRMERFDGLAILTTNLQANLDEALLRRLAVVVEFPLPGEADRLRLWDRHLAPPVPRAPDVDLAFLARAFRLSGGSIRSIALAAAYLAAEAGEAVGMSHLVRATEREYRKLGRLCGREEFGPYYHLVATPGRGDR